MIKEAEQDKALTSTALHLHPGSPPLLSNSALQRVLTVAMELTSLNVEGDRHLATHQLVTLIPPHS